MELTLGSYFLRVHKWNSVEEKTQYLNKCDLGKLELDNIRSSKTLHFTVTVFVGERKLGIGVDIDDVGLEPGLLLDLERINLIIGYDEAVTVIDLPSMNIVAHFDLDYMFYQFHSLHHLGFTDFFLVQSEVGIKAISYDGSVLWSYVASDIISSLTVSNHSIFIKFMDIPKTVILSLEDGREIIS